MSEKLRWYIVQSSFGFEKLVIESLKNRISDSSYGALFGKIASPAENVDKKDKRKNDDLFPGYVLVQMVMNDETWHLVKETPKVINFLAASKSRPTPISPKEAEKILGHGVEIKSPNELQVDDAISVTDGPFKDYSGVVKDINKENKTAQVMIMIFDRETPATLELNQLKKSP